MHKLIAALIAAILGAMLVPAPAGADEPTRILLAGDSITQGYAGDYTWRYFLDHSLRDAGTAFDFVGTRTSTFKVADDGSLDWHYDGDGAYADPAFDQDHMSYWGGSLDSTGFLYESGEQLARATSPDVMVGAFGANDLLNVDAETMLERYTVWINGARTVDADIDFVIAALPWTWRSPEVVRFNDMLDAWANEQETDASSVVVARMSEAYSQDGDTRDGIHPNVVGYRKIARMMGTALGQLGITAAPIDDPRPAGDPAPVAQPEIPAPAVAVEVARPAAATPVDVQVPSRPTRVRAHDKGRRIMVTWQRVDGAERYSVRCGGASATVTHGKTSMRSQSKRCKVQAVNATGASRWVAVRVR